MDDQMATHEKFVPTAVDVAEGSDVPDDGSTLVQQTRVKRLFSEKQLFAFSLGYLDTWIAVGGSMYYAMLNGGPRAYVFNYIIVFVGVLAQTASFCELASTQPVAGGQYYWTHRLAPPKLKRILTWCQGWTTWVGFVAGLASVLNNDALVIQGIIVINNPSYVVVGWKTFLIVAGEIVLCAVINMWFFWVVPWFELFAGIWNICFFFVTFVALWVMAPRNPASFLMETAVFSGWDNYFVSWNIGVLSQAWLFCGFEAIVHMSEDTKNAKVVIPRGLFTSVAFNGLIGLLMLFTWAICMPPDIESVINSTSPLVTIVLYATRSKTMTTVICIGRIVISFSSCMATFSSSSRLTWAWARDGGLPQYFGYVDENTLVPSRAAALTAVLVLLLALLNIGSGSYVALGAITSLSVIGFYVSYIIMLSVTLYARYGTKEGLVLGKWNMGRFGPFINAFALLYTCWFTIFLGFPSILPVTASNMNWSLPAYATIMVLAGTLWVFRARKKWPGPNEKVVDLVLKEST